MKTPEGTAVERTIFRHGDLSLAIEAAPNLDALLTDDTDPERIPWWAVVWTSAPVLAHWLLEQRDWRGTEVLELGCGVGVTGLSLAASGAVVTQTDLFPEAVALARSNMRRNAVGGMRHAAADWRHWPFRRRWSWVVGSDLLYERPSHRAILEVLSQSLAPGGEAYLADPGRPMSEGFPAAATAAGWRVERLSIGVDLYILRRPPTAR